LGLKNSQQGVVYAIPCHNCNSIYVGQTGRSLQARLKEHARAIDKGDQNNACARHARLSNHVLNLDDTKIVYGEKKFATRLSLEAYTIAANKSRLLNISPPLQSMIGWSDLLAELGAV